MSTEADVCAPTKAACSCGSVVLYVNAPVLQVCHCHCVGCRKATGAAFSTWGCVPLSATHFTKWSTLKVHQRRIDGSSERANRYFCSECGCSVAMNYPATGRWPEPNTLWLSAAFMGDERTEFGDAIHMYPEERPRWCAIDRAGCDESQLTYMGGEHQCVVIEDQDTSNAVLLLGGRAGEPSQDPGAEVQPVAPFESFRLRGVAPVPAELPGSTALAEETPSWVTGDDSVAPPPSPSAVWPLPEGSDFRVRSVEVAGAPRSISVFEVAEPTDVDGCDVDSDRSALCGGVLWPGARSAATTLATRLNARPSGTPARVVEIGCGTGLASMVAAMLGATDVLATDASTATLELVEAAAASQDLPVRTSILDLFDANVPLPEHVDFAVAADLLYSDELARAVARTLARLARRGAALIVTDSQQRCRAAFVSELAASLGVSEAEVAFEERPLGAITGWSYNDGGDATYEVSVGVLEVASVA